MSTTSDWDDRKSSTQNIGTPRSIQRKRRSWCPLQPKNCISIIPHCVSSAALLVVIFLNQSANAAAVDFINIADFYHTPGDPDDNYDAATVFALHQRGVLSLRAVCLDVPRLDVPRALTLVGDPAMMSLAQLQVMTGVSVPVAVGSPHYLTKIGDTQPAATQGDLAAVNLILATLRESRSPVAIAVGGGGRDVAIAIAREPELFRMHCRAIYFLAGVTDGENSPKENNIVVDPLGAATVFNTAPCPVYWLPGFDKWPWGEEVGHEGLHDAFYKIQQKQVLEAVSPRLYNYLAFAIRTDRNEVPELNWWRYLNSPPEWEVLANLGKKEGLKRGGYLYSLDRWMWTTAAFLHAAGLTVEEDGRIVPRTEAKSPVFDFAPITVKADDQCRISWAPTPEGKDRFILTKSSAEAYRRAMPLAVISLLKELR